MTKDEFHKIKYDLSKQIGHLLLSEANKYTDIQLKTDLIFDVLVGTTASIIASIVKDDLSLREKLEVADMLRDRISAALLGFHVHTERD